MPNAEKAQRGEEGCLQPDPLHPISVHLISSLTSPWPQRPISDCDIDHQKCNYLRDIQPDANIIKHQTRHTPCFLVNGRCVTHLPAGSNGIERGRH